MKRALICAGILAGISSQAFAQELQVNGVKIVFECDQTFSEYDAPTSPSQTATATARVPAEGGWVLTGGGCERPKNFEAVDMYSKPTDDKMGWTCQTFDYPGVRINSAIRAVARYCRIAAR